ncbi:MAG: hypothetical protein COB03_03100 [Alteromonas sp.]|nr:MAG: hypothetical protein COB03_03100 [Alteromonas sp.]
MSDVFVNLYLPEGSAVPEGVTVNTGNPTFTGTGLLMPYNAVTEIALDDSAADNDISLIFNKETNNSSYLQIRYRYVDASNHWFVSYSATTGVFRAGKMVGGTSTLYIDTDISGAISWNGGPVVFRILANGNAHEIFANYKDAPEVSRGSTTDDYLETQDGTVIYSGAGDYELRSVEFQDTEATAVDPVDPDPEPDPVEPIPDIQSVMIDGFKRQATKLGVAAYTHSQMASSEYEYWPWPVLGSEIPFWPHEQYPMLFYTTPDHSTGDGGVYLRVWEKALGNLTILVNGKLVFNQAALVEWQNVATRPEFDHITTKTNPIFVSPSNGTQTETATVNVVDGTVYIHWHNFGVNLSSVGVSGKSSQTTKRAGGTNGVDFSGNNISTFWYDPYQIEGEGHNGYAIIEVNPIESFPYTYIAKALHGGGTGALGGTNAIYGSNDCKNFYRITTVSSQYGILNEAAGFDSNRVVNLTNLGQVRKEGAYYRATGHYRLAVGGTTSTEGDICEFLIDDNFNIVSYIEPTVVRGASGEFDASQVGSGLREITFDGQTFSFYTAIAEDGSRALGAYLIEDVPHTWEVFHTLAERNELLSTTTPDNGTAPNLTYSHTPYFVDAAPSGSIQNRKLTTIPLPMDGTPSTAISTATITLADYDVIDIKFDRIGKNGIELQTLEFGLIDDLGTTTAKIAYQWPAAPETGSPAQPMEIAIEGATDETNRVTANYFGQSNSFSASGYPEDESSKHMVGIRIIPSLNKIVTLEGVALCDVFDITGFDFTKELKVFTRGYFAGVEEAEGSYAFGGLSLEAYSNDAIAVPSAPTLTTSKTTDTVTLTASNVSGATGYKYFLDGVEQDNGTFTGLQPDTEYTVYTRASNALGDSAPSTIQTITTNAEPVVNTPPTANAGNDLPTVTAGAQFQLNGSGVATQSGAAIVSYRWVQISTGTVVALSNPLINNPTGAAPNSDAAQTLTYELTVTDSNGLTATDTVSVPVAAEVVAVESSNLSVTIKGSGSGVYEVSIFEISDLSTVIYNGDATFTDDVMDVDIDLEVGVQIVGLWVGDNFPNTGGSFEGVTK